MNGRIRFENACVGEGKRIGIGQKFGGRPESLYRLCYKATVLIRNFPRANEKKVAFLVIPSFQRMGAKARGFLLFSFAFSSVFASAEILVPSKSPSRETEAPKPKETECGHSRSLEKRAIGYPSDFSEDKRAPLGFTGMRGKKDFDSDGFDKRAPIGFTGMRGKKESDKRAPSASENEKRAPLGFTGMRGKKENDFPEISDNEIIDPSEPEGSRDFFVDSGLFDDEEPSGGLYDDGTFEKRLTRAFHGARRKDDDYSFKRAMGFLGMRGKKSPEIWEWDESDKRAPQAGFFGMRGKKAPSNAFFGMRGKKAPNNAAFFGMRGKREIVADEREAIAA